MWRTPALTVLPVLAVLAVVGALAAHPATAADVVELDGVTFSAEHGGLRLLDGWGRGSRGDPFVLVEEITGQGAAVVTVRNLATRFGRTAYLGTGGGFVLRKIVTNRTAYAWTVFEMELREYMELPSGYFDGLSFSQASQRSPNFSSDRFTDIEVRDEPTDRLAFSGTVVAPGETVTVQVAITDHSPTSVFYLIQRRDAPLAAR
jgi:hypothetical protein